jgi:AraC-type DNA-binding domain-containing proteins
MEWIQNLNQAIKYIDEHLTEEIDYDKIAQIAGCSTYHFQKMFVYMAEIPLSEYIRRRKMTLAAVELQTTKEKIIDIALKYGYSSPTAFNRAFQSIHEVAPSTVRNEGVCVKSFSPLKFKITIRGVEEMNYRLETKETFRIAGVSMPLSKNIEENFAVIPQKWQKISTDGTLEKIVTLMNTEPMGVLGVSVCSTKEQWKYFIAVATTSNNTEFEERIVPKATWAIFSGSGTGASIQELEKKIITEWLPTSGYEYDNDIAVDVEVYLNADPENAQYEVWIPVVKVGN